VAALESGHRESIDGPAMLLLAAALDVPPVELFEGDGPVRLTDEVTVSRNYIREVLSGSEPTEELGLEGAAARAFIRSLPGETVSFQADAELAQRLGLRPEQVYEAAERLWGRNLHQERDRRVAELGDMTASQRRIRRGHITRQLARELAPYLPNGEGSTDGER
jgi:hypothetical protein